MPDVSGASAVNTGVHTSLLHCAHQAAGALGTRHSPRPLRCRAAEFPGKLGRIAPRGRDNVSTLFDNGPRASGPPRGQRQPGDDRREPFRSSRVLPVSSADNIPNEAGLRADRPPSRRHCSRKATHAAVLRPMAESHHIGVDLDEMLTQFFVDGVFLLQKILPETSWPRASIDNGC